ncbi:hypothetical protein P4O66_013687 [Electrophorus voltai]|uniref:Prominin 2 n=1 Tax=Electrophorus voltai TaxID=2609070 RepID=A0AAD8Z285_9TELE|nr:hypothetical protein P4O66_013687 [Electrophorus voltai]
MENNIGRQMLGVFSLLLLFLCTCVSTTPEAFCPASPNPQGLEGPVYCSLQQLPVDSGFMSPFVHSFLHSVQPNPFPKELLVSVIVNLGVITNEETIKKLTTYLYLYLHQKLFAQVLRYEKGLLVCVAIGILYIIFVPLIGFCFAFCRCCGNCGGHMYQKQTKSIHCKRRSFFWVTFFITLIILAGNICMFLSNSYTGDIVRSSTGDINNTLENLQSYFNTVPKQIHQVVNEGSVTVDKVIEDVNDIGPLLGTEIQNGLEGPFQKTLGPVTLLAQVVNSTSALLLQLNGTQLELQSSLNVLQANLTTVMEHINVTLSSSNCIGCHFFQSNLSSLSMDISLNLSTFNKLFSAVDQTKKSDLNKQIKEGQAFFTSIPQRVTNETRDGVQGFKQQLQGIKDDILHLTSNVPLSTLSNISHTLRNVQQYVGQCTPAVNMAEKIREIITVILCCLILLVVVCNFLGLLLGQAGLKPTASPTDRSNTANCGGIFLMVGVGLSFLFSWVFMIVVVILFIVGVNTYTLICVPWQTGQLFQIIDTADVFPGFQLSQSLGLKINLSVSDVYNDCHHNKSLWSTLHLGDIVDLNDVLNVSKYTVNVDQALEKMNITLPSITLLSPTVQNHLRILSTTASCMNITGIIQKINAISGTNLSLTADRLDSLANMQPNITIQTSLKNEANNLRSLQTWIHITINPLLWQLNSTIENISVIALQINGTVGNVLENFSYAQSFLNNNTSTIVKQKTRDFADCHIGFFASFAKWANETITDQVGSCGTVATAIDKTEQLVCTQLVESVNAFWFSLGWCSVFLIPNIIFSVKLAKYYRRMKYTDVNE